MSESLKSGGELFIVDNSDEAWKGLRYQQLIRDNPALEPFLNSCPLRLFSGKEHTKPGTKAVFLCYRLPAEDRTLPPEQAWDGEAGRTGW